MTSDLNRKARIVTVSATSRLVTFSPKLRGQVLFGKQISGVRQVAMRALRSLQAQRRRVTSAMVLIFVAAASIAFLTLADGDLGSLASLAREIIPPNLPASARNPIAAGLITQDENRTPGTDFTGAYVLGVEHLSASSSMIEILVPAGVEGTYLAVVTVSEGVEYECTILHHYRDRLYCIGPSLPGASQTNLRIFRIDEVDGSQFLVFEADYATSELALLDTRSPEFMPLPIQTPTPAPTPTRFIVLTADDSDPDDGHPPPAPPVATDTPPSAPPTATDMPPPADTPIPPPPTESPKPTKPGPCNRGHPENCPPTPGS